MTKLTLSLAAATAALALTSAASAAVVFDQSNFVGNPPNDPPINGETTQEITEDGVTLTLTSLTAGSTFLTTGGGTGIGVGANTTDGDRFDVNPGESYSLSFDTAGTLDSFTYRILGGGGRPNAEVTFTNGTDAETVTLIAPSSGFSDLSTAIGLDFAAGDSIVVTGTGVSTTDDFSYRVRSITITQATPIPEPTAGLAVLGGMGLLGLRRRQR